MTAEEMKAMIRPAAPDDPIFKRPSGIFMIRPAAIRPSEEDAAAPNENPRPESESGRSIRLIR